MHFMELNLLDIHLYLSLTKLRIRSTQVYYIETNKDIHWSKQESVLGNCRGSIIAME